MALQRELRLIEVQTAQVEVAPLTMYVTPMAISTRQAESLSTDWCDCATGGFFLCCIEDGTCTCGIARPHTHCKVCGGIL